MDANKDKYDLDDLKQLMPRLRSPDDGCPWDVEQTFETIKPHTIEEAYEVADAIERNDMNDLKDELGDLLFQVLFHAQMASEQNVFSVDDVVDHVTKKMIFRHPHVFTDNKAENAKDVEENVWEQQKAKEKGDRQDKNTLDSVTRALPSLLLANKIQKKAHKVGFRFPSLDEVFAKLDEEVAELQHAIGEDGNVAEEYGDVLLAATLLGTHLRLNPEEQLRMATLKFIARFNAVEDELGDLHDKSLEEMMDSWSKAKAQSQKPL